MAEGKPSSASQSLTPIALCRLKLQKFWNNVLKDITDKPKIWPNSIRSLTILHDRSKLDITDLPKIWLDSIRFLNISHDQSRPLFLFPENLIARVTKNDRLLIDYFVLLKSIFKNDLTIKA